MYQFNSIQLYRHECQTIRCLSISLSLSIYLSFTCTHTHSCHCKLSKWLDVLNGSMCVKWFFLFPVKLLLPACDPKMWLLVIFTSQCLVTSCITSTSNLHIGHSETAPSGATNTTVLGYCHLNAQTCEPQCLRKCSHKCCPKSAGADAEGFCFFRHWNSKSWVIIGFQCVHVTVY